MKKGTLFLIPNSLGGEYADITPIGTPPKIEHLRHFVVEEIRSARRFLKGIGFATDFEEIQFTLLNEHSARGMAAEALKPLLQGIDVGLISEAGCPAVADPGADLVSAAHQSGVPVVPLTGASSIILTLMASGLNGQNFAFSGYVPRDSKDRVQRIRQLEQLALSTGQTQLFMDAPYRNDHLFEDLVNTLKPTTRLCVAAEITCQKEYLITRFAGDWKKNAPPALNKRPVMFAIGR